MLFCPHFCLFWRISGTIRGTTHTPLTVATALLTTRSSSMRMTSPVGSRGTSSFANKPAFCDSICLDSFSAVRKPATVQVAGLLLSDNKYRLSSKNFPSCSIPTASPLFTLAHCGSARNCAATRLESCASVAASAPSIPISVRRETTPSFN